MQFLKLAATLVLAGAAAAAQATPIGLSAFDGSEHVIDFNDLQPFWGPNLFPLGGVTFAAGSDWSLQHSASGAIIGTSGAAINETGSTDHDFTLWFDAPVGRFGANVGIGYGIGAAAMTVTAYDNASQVVESRTWNAFDNTFVGFDFAKGVSKVVFDRFDNLDAWTFLDDVRYVNGDGNGGNGGNGGGNVPEPASLALLAAGAAGAAFARRRARR
jgi:hypothetical protein